MADQEYSKEQTPNEDSDLLNEEVASRTNKLRTC